MRLWMPDRVFFEPSAQAYPMGQKILEFCENHKIPILETTSHNQIRGIPGENEKAKYANAKKTLVVGTKKSLKLDVCKPSAHYQFSLMTNCPGHCEYCYLFTTQGKKPYVRVYVNLQDIFEAIDKYSGERLPETTSFEAASTGDPLAVEHITGGLKETIEHFGTLAHARLRVVTKFANVEPVLNAEHHGHTRFRFSINTEHVIDRFEHNTDSLQKRLEAAQKIARARYEIGFLVAPIILHENWKEAYKHLIDQVRAYIPQEVEGAITFELIQHRFTGNAKKIILERYPNTKLDMDENKRALKYGKYGRMKYVYPKSEVSEMKAYISDLITASFPNGRIQYFT